MKEFKRQAKGNNANRASLKPTIHRLCYLKLSWMSQLVK